VREDRWLLPDGIEEVLPPAAGRIEATRRRILDLFQSWGYELVIPPLIEYLESLLTGLGRDLDLQTFKITDQLSGRMMGIRADMTPQVARIDAHCLKRDVPTRLCYLGPILHTRTNGLGGSRNPFQVGAELYGHAGLESDVEVLCLMIETLKAAGISTLYVDLGHMGIFRGLAREAGLSPEQEGEIFDCLQRKALPELEESLRQWGVGGDAARLFTALVELNGDVSVLEEAQRLFVGAPEDVRQALDNLSAISALVSQRAASVTLHVDLAEFRGYHYHTGVMFAAYTPGQGQALAKGGRYDSVGQVFGRPRPATGFSTDLKLLIQVGSCESETTDRIYAPWSAEPALTDEIEQLRKEGHQVICALPGQTGGPREMNCTKELVLQDGHWVSKDV
jgi:ATP phosphoribosyltransferase regulatory subunit